MKTLLLALALLSPAAHAESLAQIFQQIADTTEPGNGNGHNVLKLHGPYNERREAARLHQQVNKRAGLEGECAFRVHTDVKGALKDMKSTWDADATAKRLAGLDRAGLIQGIVWSQWDNVSGDSEYCSVAVMRVFAVDGTVLELNFDQTD